MSWIFSIAYYDLNGGLSHAVYAIEAVVTTAVLTNMLQFGVWVCRLRKGELTHWQRWDGAYFLLAAVPLSLALPLSMVVIYVGGAGYPESQLWTNDSPVPNSPHGAVLYATKWIGTMVLTVGVFKVTRVHVKIKKRWRELRRPPNTSRLASTSTSPDES